MKRYRWLVALGVPAGFGTVAAVSAVGMLMFAAAGFQLATTAGPSPSPAHVSIGCGQVTAGVLATIRTMESRNDYGAHKDAPPFPSGAYQFLDSTWNGYGGYQRAYLAPPAVQDQRAAEWANGIVATYGVELVPAVWYIGHVPDASQWDTVPARNQGNTVTVRSYQTSWLAVYARLRTDHPCAAADFVAPALPPSHTMDGDPRLAAYPNGTIPPDLLVAVDAQDHRLAPYAATDYLAMVAAAQTDGIGWTINSAYRSLGEQADLVTRLGLIQDGGLAAAVGHSPHGLGVAVDLQLAPDALAWLRTNAARFGFYNSAPPEETWHWQDDRNVAERG